MDVKFHPYQHIEHLNREECEGLLDGRVYVYPKLDGTNACIWRDSDMILRFGSRKRELQEGNDNAGFMEHMLREPETVELLNKFFDQMPDTIIYGEWLVPHTLKTYSQDCWRKLYVFDVFDVSVGKYLHINTWSPVLDTLLIETSHNHLLYIIPCIWTGDGKKLSDDMIKKFIDDNDYLMASGVGEGIVIKNYDYTNPFGRSIWGKVVREEFKTKHIMTMGASPLKECIEDKIVAKFLTGHVIAKEWQHIEPMPEDLRWSETLCDYYVLWHPKYYPQLFSRVWKTFIEEETYAFIKWAKNPSIDFKRLRNFVTNAVKQFVENGGLNG